MTIGDTGPIEVVHIVNNPNQVFSKYAEENFQLPYLFHLKFDC